MLVKRTEPWDLERFWAQVEPEIDRGFVLCIQDAEVRALGRGGELRALLRGRRPSAFEVLWRPGPSKPGKP